MNKAIITSKVRPTYASHVVNVKLTHAGNRNKVRYTQCAIKAHMECKQIAL